MVRDLVKKQLLVQIEQTVMRILRKQEKCVFGVVGPQGTGKSYFSKELKDFLTYVFKKDTIDVSLDDFYLSYQERKEQGIELRGAPGTHNLFQMNKFFTDFISDKKFIQRPIFDKGLFNGQGDRLKDKKITNPQLLIFEGWLIGLQSIGIDSESDKLLRLYEPIWQYIDVLIILKPEDFKYNYQWRKDAEKENKTGQMTEAQLTSFVDHFFTCINPELYYPYLINNIDKTKYKEAYVVQIGMNHKFTHIEKLKEYI